MSAESGVGAHTDRPKSQREAARRAGMSKHQEMQAIRVSSVPRDVFEALVESDNPPTATKLAELGRAYRRGDLVVPEPTPRTPLAVRTLSEVRRFSNFAADAEPADVVRELDPEDRQAVAELAAVLVEWLDRIRAHMDREADR